MARAVLVDSSSGLTSLDLKQYPDSFLVAGKLVLPNHDAIADDGSHITRHEFYQILKNNIVKTIQINPFRLQKTWDKILTTHDQIVFFCLTKTFSSQYENACLLAREPKYRNRIFIPDLRAVSLLMIKAINFYYHAWHTNAHFNAQAFQAAWQEELRRYDLTFFTGNTKYLKASGRISKPVALFCSQLKIIPILKIINGHVVAGAKTRTIKRAITKIITGNYQLLTATNSPKELYIGYSSPEEPTYQQTLAYAQSLSFTKIICFQIPNIILAHSGPSTVTLVVKTNADVGQLQSQT